MKIIATKIKMIIDSEDERPIMDIVDPLVNPDYDVVIEQIGNIIITVERSVSWMRKGI